MDMHLYGLFILTGMSMAYSPGPSVIYTVLATWRHGKQNMRSRVAGQIASLIVYGAVSFLGVGTLMNNYPGLIPILTIIGSLYLGYIAIMQISLTANSIGTPKHPSVSGVPTAHSSNLKGFKEGLMVGLSNPKIMLVYLIIIPQFTSIDYDIPIQMAVLIGSQWIIKSSALLFYVQLSDRLSGLINQPRTRQNIINVFSGILILIAAYILVSAVAQILNTP